MASPPQLTPANTTGFNRQTWLSTIEAPTYAEEILAQTIRKYTGDLLNLGNVRKAARALGTELAQADVGTGLTASDITGTPITISPKGRYIKVEWSWNEKAQVDVDLSSNGTPAKLERGMAETLDTAGFALVATGTQIKSQAAIDATMWRQATGLLMQNTNTEYRPGRDTIYAVFTPTQYPAVMAIEEFTHADIRGGSETPQVAGIVAKGNGSLVNFSTAVLQDANGWHCPLYVRDAFIYGENQSTTAFEEQTEALFRIVIYNNRGYSVLHDLRFVDMRLTASQL